MSLAFFFGFCLMVSSVAIRCGMLFANRFGALDHPGGHKQHDSSTPFVGGVGVIVVVLGVLQLGSVYFPELSQHRLQALALGAMALFLTGFADDLWHLNFKTRFLIQALAAMSMVILGEVELISLGQLFPGVNVQLGAWATPFTLFATIGLINALNMIDGIDGLSGTLSFIALGFTAAVAALAGHASYLVFIVGVMGGVGGFLFYNLRYPSNIRARVFLGDNGSMLLGFVFAWLFIAMSQGEHRAMPPVTALWLFGVPLLDTVNVMLRRLWMRKSPFKADRNHLHHMFIRAGFRVSDTVWILALLQLALGAFGVAGLLLALPDWLMFGLFLLTFAGYFYVTVRPWRFVPILRRINAALAFPSVDAQGVFVGYFSDADSRQTLVVLSREMAGRFGYRISLHKVYAKAPGTANIYAVVQLDGGVDEVSVGEVRRLMATFKTRLAHQPGVQVRLFMQRNSANDRRKAAAQDAGEGSQAGNRLGDRRAAETEAPLTSTTVSRAS